MNTLAAHAMSPTMWNALGSMPVSMRRTGRGWCRPVDSPTAVTLAALTARGLIRYDAHQRIWTRTSTGEQAWSER